MFVNGSMVSGVAAWLDEAEVHSEKVSPEAEKSTSAENGVVHTEVLHPLHSLNPVAEADTRSNEDWSTKEEELEFPHDFLPSIDLSTELNLTWGVSIREDGEAVSTESSSLLQLQSAGIIQENAPSLQSSETMLDRELQEAFQECEEQIASFGLCSHSITLCSTDQTDSCLSEAKFATDDEEHKSVNVKKDPMSLPISLAESQTGRDLGCHGNVGAHTTDLGSCTEEAVFCFRDYVLGKTQPEEAMAEYSEEHSEKLHCEPKEEFQKVPKMEKSTDKTKSAERKEHLIKHDSATEALTETEVNKISEIQDVLEVVSLVSHKDSLNEQGKIITGPVEKPQMTPETGTQIITTVMDNKSLKGFSPENNTNYCSVSETSDRDGIQLNTQTFLEQMQIITQTKVSSKTNPELMTKADNQIELLDTHGQLGHLCTSPLESLSNQAHLTPLEATPALKLDHLQVTEQQSDCIGADGLCKSISEYATLNLNSTGDIEHEKCEFKLSTDSIVIDFRDVKSSEHEHEKRCSSEACPLKEEEEEEEEENVFFIGSEAGTHTVVRGKTLSLSRNHTKRIKTEEESALEKTSASAVDFTPPLTTSTMPEMIEVGEKGTGDPEGVKTTEKGHLDHTTELQCSDGKLSEIIAAKVHLCSLSFPEINNSPAKEVEAASEERWSGRKMLQNSDENEKKGGGLPADCSLGMDSLSAASEKETGTASVEDMTVAAAFPEFNDRRDWKIKSYESLEKKGEGGTEEGTGKERGGTETLYGQEALSMTVLKSYPLHDNGVTLVAPQQRGELITLVTEDIADTALPLLTSSLRTPSSSIFPLNDTEAERKEASEKAAHLKESFNAVGEKQPNSDILNLLSTASADGKDPAAQTSYQQVLNTSWIQTEINTTQQNKVGKGKDTCKKSEGQHPLSSVQLDIKSSTGSFNNMDGGTGDPQDDPAHQATEFASLPPLTVHENLRHPVSETSFSFQRLFSNIKPDPPQKVAYTICESTSEAEVTEENMSVNENPERHIEGEKENVSKEILFCQNSVLLPKNKEVKDEIVVDQSTLELKPLLEDTNETNLELQDIAMEDVGSDNTNLFSLSDLIVPGVEKKTEVVLSTKEVDGREAKSVENDVRENFEDNFQSILSDIVQQESKLELLTSEGSLEQCLKSEEAPFSCTDGDGILSRHFTDSKNIPKKDLKANTEQDSAIYLGCPQAKCEELQYQMDSSHDTGPASDVAMSVVSTKAPTPTAIKVSSTVEGGVPSASANIQSDTKVPIVLRPPGPMMSHWEVINDYNVSLPGEEMQCSQEAEMSSNIVETDTVEKPEPGKTTGEYSLSCMNVLNHDITAMASSVQDTKLASREVEGTHLISDSPQSGENTNKGIDYVVFENSKDGKREVDVKPWVPEKLLNMGHNEGPLSCSIQSTAKCTRKDDMLSSQLIDSEDISKQDQIPNSVILEKCSQEKPEKNMSELQYQIDLVHESGTDLKAALSVVSSKELTPPERDAFGMGEGELSSSNIQSDSKVPIVHRPSGPMMSHREVINEDNVSVSEEETQCNYNKICPQNSGSVGAADMRNKIVKTDTVEKPEGDKKTSEETKKEINETDNSSFCMNVLIPDIQTDTVSSEQDIKLACEEVEGTILAPDSFRRPENANKVKSTNSNDIFQWKQKSNSIILEECFQAKPEENTSKMQCQTDIDHDSAAVSEVDMSFTRAKDLTHPDSTLSAMGEEEVSFSSIQSDPLETPKEHSETVDTMREKNETDKSSHSVMASSVQDTRLVSGVEVEDTNLKSVTLHSVEKANEGTDFVAQEDSGELKTEVDVLTSESGRQLSTHHKTNQITHTKDTTESSTIRQGTEQNTLSDNIQHCDDNKFDDKCNVISKINVSRDKVYSSFGCVSSALQNRIADIQSSPSVHEDLNSLVEIDTSKAEEYYAIELSTVIPQHSGLKTAASETNRVQDQGLIEDTGSLIKDDTVRTNKPNQEHTDEENPVINLEQLEEPESANDASLFKEQTTRDKFGEIMCEQLIDSLVTLKDQLSGNLKEEINRLEKTNPELQERDQYLEKEVGKVQTNVQQKLIEAAEEKKNKNEEKHLDEKVPETSLKACLSDSGLIPTGFVKEVQSCDRDLIEATQPSMDQDLEQVTCYERDQMQNQTVFNEMDLAQPTELQKTQECIEAAETVENRVLEKYDDVSLKETKVSCPSHEVQANETLERKVESEISFSSFVKMENVTLLMNHENVITEGDGYPDGKQNQSEPNIKSTDFGNVSSIIKDLNEETYTEDRNEANQIKLENQENKFMNISVEGLENSEINTELKELTETFIQASQISKDKPHLGHTSKSRVSVGEPGHLEKRTPELCKTVEIANGLSEPCGNSNSSHCANKTEVQCSSAITFDKNKCTEVFPSVQSEARLLSVYQAPVEKLESESIGNVSQDMDNEELANQDQIHKIKLSSMPLQGETLPLEMEPHNKDSLDPKHPQHNECRETFDHEALHTEFHGLTTSAGTEEEPKNKKTQTAISGEVKQLGQRKEEISGCKDDGIENETAEGRKLLPGKTESRAVECELKDIKEGNERQLPKHKGDNSLSFTVQTVSGGTSLLQSSVSDGLQTEQEKQLSSSPYLTAVVTVSSSQHPFQTLLNANADSSHGVANSFIQTMCENASEGLKTEHGSKDAEGEFTKEVQKEKCDGNEHTEKLSTDEDRSDTLKTSILSEEAVSDSLGAAVSPEMELNQKTLNLEESCESSDWLRAMKEAAGISQSKQKSKLGTPCKSTDNRPFETLDIPQAELESDSPIKDSEHPDHQDKEQPEEPTDSRPLVSESADGSESVFSFSPPPEEDALLPALPAHLFCDSSEFPTPPPTPPDSTLLEPEPECAPPVSPPDPDQVPDTAEVLLQYDPQPDPPSRCPLFFEEVSGLSLPREPSFTFSSLMQIFLQKNINGSFY
ncbi:uncharacterized protein tacc2 [Tachysurus ichikawai]